MQRSRNMREVLDALDWVRREMMFRGSPDFLRQRLLEQSVRELAARMTRRGAVPRSRLPERH